MLLAILVPRSRVKTIKTVLERQGLLNKDLKIRLDNSERGLNSTAQYVVPTSIRVSNAEEAATVDEKQLIPDIDTAQHVLLSLFERELPDDKSGEVTFDDFTFVNEKVVQDVGHNEYHTKSPSSKLADKIGEAFRSLGSDVELAKDFSEYSTVLGLPGGWCVYGDLLLLPSTYRSNPTWQTLVKSLERNPSAKAAFFDNLCRSLEIGHIAVNAPIPAVIPNLVGSLVDGRDEAVHFDTNAPAADNVIRSPISLEPIYGDFGPQLPHFPAYQPIEKDFDDAYWVTTKQNGIFQTWAPLYTMFSSGNVTEKARLLRNPNVLLAIEEGSSNKRGSTAVDLFAGIGYFAFSYLQAGVDIVLCWDLNPWSVHGLRRGAAKNKWTCINGRALNDLGARDAPAREVDKSPIPSRGLIYFNESNKLAEGRLNRLRISLPPIRHVNCGMLPSATQSISTAIQAIDPWLGGWLHLHEVVRQDKLGERAREIQTLAENILQDHKDLEHQGNHLCIRIVDIVKVKSVAPRTLHVVLDMAIPARLGADYGGGEV